MLLKSSPADKVPGQTKNGDSDIHWHVLAIYVRGAESLMSDTFALVHQPDIMLIQLMKKINCADHSYLTTDYTLQCSAAAESSCRTKLTNTANMITVFRFVVAREVNCGHAVDIYGTGFDLQFLPGNINTATQDTSCTIRMCLALIMFTGAIMFIIVYILSFNGLDIYLHNELHPLFLPSCCMTEWETAALFMFFIHCAIIFQ